MLRMVVVGIEMVQSPDSTESVSLFAVVSDFTGFGYSMPATQMLGVFTSPGNHQELYRTPRFAEQPHVG